MDMDLGALNIFDLIILSIIGLSTLFAFFKGFIKTLLSFLVWIGSLLASFFLAPFIEPLVAKQISNGMIANIVSSSVAFIGAAIFLGIISMMISSSIKPISEGVVDRSLGFAFGLFRGLAFACIIFLSIVLTHAMMMTEDSDKAGVDGLFESDAKIAKTGPEWVKGAQTYTLLYLGSRTLLSFAPEGSMDNFGKTVDKIRGETEKKISEIAKEKLEGGKLLNSDVDIGKIKEAIDPEMVDSLKKQWNNAPKSGNDSAEEAGYSADQLKQIERLVEQIQ